MPGYLVVVVYPFILLVHFCIVHFLVVLQRFVSHSGCCFVKQVCRKVEEKGSTSYNEVADELVQELAMERPYGTGKETQYDDKNIRRRVYDALNVLMAIDIISKDRKEIK